MTYSNVSVFNNSYFALSTSNFAGNSGGNEKIKKGGAFSPSVLEQASIMRSSLDNQWENAFIIKYQALMQNRLNRLKQDLTNAYKSLVEVSSGQQIRENGLTTSNSAVTDLYGNLIPNASDAFRGIHYYGTQAEFDAGDTKADWKGITKAPATGPNTKSDGIPSYYLVDKTYQYDGSGNQINVDPSRRVEMRELSGAGAAMQISNEMKVTFRSEEVPSKAVDSSILGINLPNYNPPFRGGEKIAQAATTVNTGGFWSTVNYLYDFAPRQMKYKYATSYSTTTEEAGTRKNTTNGGQVTLYDNSLVDARDMQNTSGGLQTNQDGPTPVLDSMSGVSSPNYPKSGDRVKWSSSNPDDGYITEQNASVMVDTTGSLDKTNIDAHDFRNITRRQSDNDFAFPYLGTLFSKADSIVKGNTGTITNVASGGKTYSETSSTGAAGSTTSAANPWSGYTNSAGNPNSVANTPGDAIGYAGNPANATVNDVIAYKAKLKGTEEGGVADFGNRLTWEYEQDGIGAADLNRDGNIDSSDIHYARAGFINHYTVTAQSVELNASPDSYGRVLAVGASRTAGATSGATNLAGTINAALNQITVADTTAFSNGQNIKISQGGVTANVTVTGVGASTITFSPPLNTFTYLNPPFVSGAGFVGSDPYASTSGNEKNAIATAVLRSAGVDASAEQIFADLDGARDTLGNKLIHQDSNDTKNEKLLLAGSSKLGKTFKGDFVSGISEINNYNGQSLGAHGGNIQISAENANSKPLVIAEYEGFERAKTMSLGFAHDNYNDTGLQARTYDDALAIKNKIEAEINASSMVDTDWHYAEYNTNLNNTGTYDGVMFRNLKTVSYNDPNLGAGSFNIYFNPAMRDDPNNDSFSYIDPTTGQALGVTNGADDTFNNVNLAFRKTFNLTKADFTTVNYTNLPYGPANTPGWNFGGYTNTPSYDPKDVFINIDTSNVDMNTFQLLVNGKVVTPVSTTATSARYNLKGFLQEGDNVIASQMFLTTPNPKVAQAGKDAFRLTSDVANNAVDKNINKWVDAQISTVRTNTGDAKLNELSNGTNGGTLLSSWQSKLMSQRVTPAMYNSLYLPASQGGSDPDFVLVNSNGQVVASQNDLGQWVNSSGVVIAPTGSLADAKAAFPSATSLTETGYNKYVEALNGLGGLTTSTKVKDTNSFSKMLISILNKPEYRDIFNLGLLNSNNNKSLTIKTQVSSPSGGNVQATIDIQYDPLNRKFTLYQSKWDASVTGPQG